MNPVVHQWPDQQLFSDENCTRGGEEEGELGECRRKLLAFLDSSDAYSAQKALLLLDDHLVEEKAIVFGRLKRHEEALFIYTSVLMDFQAAERHCVKYYDPADEVNSEVSTLKVLIVWLV